jgi:hypothetical protein
VSLGDTLGSSHTCTVCSHTRKRAGITQTDKKSTPTCAGEAP